MFAALGRHLRQQYAGFLALLIVLGGVSYVAVKGDLGDLGARGAAGAEGLPGISGYQRVVSRSYSNPAGARTSGYASCPAGKLVLGGGAYGTGGAARSIASSFPSKTDSRVWAVDMNNTSGKAQSFSVFAICGVVQ